MALAADTQLGPYKIISLIGWGGMGEVYRARDTRLQRDIALKVFPASFTSDPERLRRFEQEARAVAALNHPNIVSVHDVGNASGIHYIVSELLEGETLRARITEGGMLPRKAIELAVQLAHGLATAHDKVIVHRDPARGPLTPRESPHRRIGNERGFLIKAHPAILNRQRSS